jgi:hypothetical protein
MIYFVVFFLISIIINKTKYESVIYTFWELVINNFFFVASILKLKKIPNI